jgi:hypothetical protein
MMPTLADVWSTDVLQKAPEMWPIQATLQPFLDLPDWPNLTQWNDVANGRGLKVRFGENVVRKRGAPWVRRELYDGVIFHQGIVPSREQSWHDFFNMCIWQTFPQAKAAINQAQWHALTRWLPEESGQKLPGARLPEQDALALLDEGGVLLLHRTKDGPTVQQCVQTGNEEELAERCHSGDIVTILFGHALYEHLATPDLRQGETRGAYTLLECGDNGLPLDRDTLLQRTDQLLAEAIKRGRGVKRGAPGISIRLAGISAQRFG